jgi:putative transposase
MSKINETGTISLDANADILTETLREGASRLIQQAVQDELQELLDKHAHHRLPDGRASVVRNGYLPGRSIQTGIGPVSIKVPKIRSKTGEAVTFRSAMVPPYVRKTKTIDAALPWLYLKGISTGEMDSAMKALLGPNASSLSASTVSRLKRNWAKEYGNWRKTSLNKHNWVYIWADGIYSGLRSEDTKLCTLVVIGVNEYGEKHFLAIEDGVRESTQSWREVLLGLKSRGLGSPKLAIGDGAMGFWNATDELLPKTRHQRCWMHKAGNVLNFFPKLSQPKVKDDLHQIWMAETKSDAESAFDLFVNRYKVKYPKATNCLLKDRDVLLSFYDFPAEHWRSIRTSNPIESAFGTIRHRTKRSKGCLSRDGMLHMIFKLGMCAEERWNRLHGFNMLAKVIRNVEFEDGIEVKTGDQNAA